MRGRNLSQYCRPRAQNRAGVYVRFALLVSFLTALASEASGQRLPIKAYTTTDGLGHNEVRQIVRDSVGLLWFCTADGLSRFDGSRFTTYNLEDGLPSLSINGFLETRAGARWVATNGGGVALLNSTANSDRSSQNGAHPHFQGYRISNEPVTNRVNVLFEDSAGAVWAGTDGGLFRMNQSNGQPEFQRVELRIPLRPEISVQVWAFAEGDGGTLWVGTKFGLVHFWPDGRSIHYEIAPTRTSDTVHSVLKDSEGNLWLGHDTGVIVFTPEPGWEAQARSGRSFRLPESALRYPTGNRSTDSRRRIVFQSATGRKWVSDTSPRLSASDGKTSKPYSLGEFLGDDGITSIAEDSGGNLWLGTGSSGALKLAMQGFITYDGADGLGSAIGTVFENHTGELYVSSSQWLISRFDGEKFVSIRPNLPKPVLNTYWRGTGILQDRAGEWWIGTRVGLYRFARVNRFEQLGEVRPKAVYTRNDGLADDDVTYLFEDSRGDIWIAGFSVGGEVLTRWERATETFHRYTESDGLPALNAASSFCEDLAGNVWIGFREGGLARYREGRFTTLTERDGLPTGGALSLYLDASGRLWLCQPQSGTLSRIDNTQAAHLDLVVYTKDAGLNAHRLSRVVGDRAGRLYIGNSRGIDQLDPKTGQIKHYTASDGVMSGELRCALGDRKGNLWFGTSKGLLLLNPQPAQDAGPPPIYLDDIYLGGKAYGLSKLGEKEVSELELKPDRNQIQIDFFGLSFGTGEVLRYQYKLEGSSSDWSVPTEERSVNFASLAPGSYNFLVRAVNSNGATSESPAVVRFRILPPLWRTWWFLATAGLLVAAVVFAFARSRLARMRAERESDRRFRTLAETASDAIITIDQEGHIVLVNQAAERVFGYSIPEMLRKDLTMLMPEYLRHLHREGFARYKETGVRHISWQSIELTGLHKNGSEIPLEISFGEFNKDDRRFFTGIARDITERKRAELERKHAEEALRRSREERLTELERVRRRIATDLHDDVGSSLTQISLLSEVVQRQVDGVEAPVKQPLSSIARLSRELVDSMSDIVWAINPTKDHLSDLSQRMRHFASDLLTARQIDFRFRSPDPEHNIAVGANFRRELFLLFKEAVNNMVRHSGCSHADIEFRAGAEALFLRLTDDGCGFDMGQQSKGHGLASMRERTEGLGGCLEITSAKGQGTALLFTIPFDHSGGEADE